MNTALSLLGLIAALSLAIGIAKAPVAESETMNETVKETLGKIALY